MFQDVLFPRDADAVGSAEGQTLQLRRLKRFLPLPEHQIWSGSVVVFDFETTGLDPETDRIIEIGAIKLVNMQPVAEFSSLVSTDIELTEDIVRLTGITPEMLKGQPEVEDVLPKFMDFIEGSVIAAHNAEFDLSMLRASLSRMGIDLEWPCFCTLKMARELLPDLERKNLDTLAEHYNLTFEARHRSIGDVKVTCGVLSGMLAKEAQHLLQWNHMQNFMVI
jgi:DNA polymerase III epsilon subunit family exonuclease